MSKYGCKKDQPDKRDYKITRMTAIQAAVIPNSIDYTPKMGPVGDQGDEGTCVGFATVDGMKVYQEDIDQGKFLGLSVRYVYENARIVDDDPPDEEGTSIRAAMSVLTDKGVPPESCWPYVPHLVGKPCPEADALAAPNQEAGYWRIDGADIVQAIKESLVANGPLVVGINVYESFEDPIKSFGGNIPMPESGEQLLGGHAVCIVGYDDKTEKFKFKNSWSKLWGNFGFGTLPYAYMEQYLNDAWSAKDKLGNNPPGPGFWQRILNFFKWLFRVNK